MAKTRVGVLDFHDNDQSQGALWILVEGFTAMIYYIEPGDHLTIFNADGSVLFNEVITPDYITGRQPYPQHPEHLQQQALGHWIHWIQDGWQPDDWARLFVRYDQPKLRAILTRQ